MLLLNIGLFSYLAERDLVSSEIILLFMSTCRFARVGSVVLALHDASDVFLEVGKMSKYSGAEALASFAFILFVLSWVLLRLIYYPFWILWSTRWEQIPKYLNIFCSCKYFYVNVKTYNPNIDVNSELLVRVDYQLSI